MTRYDELSTERLRMRRWRDSDRAPFAAMNADPQVMRHFPSLMTAEATDAFVDLIERRFEDQGYGLWALQPLDESSDFIGYAGLNAVPHGIVGAGGMEAGWRLQPSAWGHGYATEAGREAIRVAFEGIGLTEVWSMTAVTNTPSIRVMQRLGMSEYTRFEHPRVPEGSPVRPHVMYHLSADDWG